MFARYNCSTALPQRLFDSVLSISERFAQSVHCFKSISTLQLELKALACYLDSYLSDYFNESLDNSSINYINENLTPTSMTTLKIISTTSFSNYLNDSSTTR